MRLFVCAKDDAAGQAIANRFQAQTTGLSQAQRNANDGISVAQTAEGALNQVNDNVQRIRELSVQATNGTNSQEDLQSIQDEIGQRLGEIDRISEQTDFNGVKVLSGSAEPISIQVGANDGETISVDLQTINSNTLGLEDFDITDTLQQVSAGDDAFTGSAITFDGTSSSAFTKNSTSVAAADIDAAATSGLGKATFGGADVIDKANLEIREFDGEQYAVNTDSGNEEVYTIESTSVTSDELIVELGEKVSGDIAQVGDQRGSSFDFKGGDSDTSYSVVTDGTDKFVRAEKEGADTTYTKITATDIESDGKGVVEIDINNDLATSPETFAAETLDPMAQLDDALSKIDGLRSNLGAVQNRFESAITNLSTNETNLSAAQSRIEDADYAKEVANMTKNQILQQAGTSVLAQANQLPQSVLSLLG